MGFWTYLEVFLALVLVGLGVGGVVDALAVRGSVDLLAGLVLGVGRLTAWVGGRHCWFWVWL